MLSLKILQFFWENNINTFSATFYAPSFLIHKKKLFIIDFSDLIANFSKIIEMDI